MKIKPTIYAQLLLEGIKGKTDKKKLVANFWSLLQKNKQHKDLPKILDALDKEYAKERDAVLVTIFSAESLGSKEEAEIKSKIAKKIGKKEIILKNTIKNDLIGYIVKIDDEEIDLTINDRLIRLKKIINN